MAASTFRWLQLSDLHVGMVDQDWLWPTFKHAVLDDLSRLYKKFGPWDLVVFSGDLVQKGASSEFLAFDKVLSELWALFRQLGFDPPLFVLPGNHDIERTDPKDPLAILLKMWNEKKEVRDGFFDLTENRYRDFVQARFCNFNNWLSKSSCDHIRLLKGVTGLLPGDSAVKLQVGDTSVGLIGLNSTWLQLDGANYHERLHVDPKQLLALTGDNPTQWCLSNQINLLFTHHPQEWLFPKSLQIWNGEIYLADRFDVHIFGHMHESFASSTSIAGFQPKPRIQAPSLFGLQFLGDGRSERSHGYFVGEFQLTDSDKRLLVAPRVAIKGHDEKMRLAPDHRFNLEDERYVLIHESRVRDVASFTNSAVPVVDLGETTSNKEVLRHLEHPIYASDSHKRVRRVEQQRCIEILSLERVCRITSGWNLGLDEFIASLQMDMAGSDNTYMIDLGDFDNTSAIVDFLDSRMPYAVSEICGALAKVAKPLVILANANTLTESVVRKVDGLAR